MGLWGGGICTIFIFGCVFAGVCILIHYIHSILAWIKGLVYKFVSKLIAVIKNCCAYCQSWNINWKFVGVFLFVVAVAFLLLYYGYDKCNISNISRKVSIPLIIALVAMSAPLIIQNINGIDAKYHGTRITTAFKESNAFVFFKFCMGFVAVGLFLELCFWDKKWSNILFIIFSLALLIAIVYLCVNLVKFYDFQSMTCYIKKQYKTQSVHQHNNVSMFNALVDCLCYSISQNDKEHTKELLAIFNNEFAAYRLGSSVPKVDYPAHYYNYIQEVTEFICRNNYTHILRQDADIPYMLPISCLFPDSKETDNCLLSDKTFKAIWKTLQLFDTYNHGELYISYWECAQRYYNSHYYSMGTELTKSFIAFQEEFGALLLANKHYTILHDIILWTKKPENKKKFDISTFFRDYPLFAPLEKLVELEPEKILPRYIHLMCMLDKGDSEFYIPNMTSTQEMPRPLKEYCIRYMSLLYLWATKTVEKMYHFYYEDGEEIGLPNEVTTDTIEKQVKDLERAANSLIKDDHLLKAFPNINNIKSVASPMHFVEVIRQRNKLNLRISDIPENVYKEIDNSIVDSCKQAFEDCPITKQINNRKQTEVSSGIYFSHLILKANVNEKIYIDLKANMAYNVVSELYKSFQKIPASNVANKICPINEFLSQIEKRIHMIKKKSDYIIVSDDSRIQRLFESSANYNEKRYLGIDVKCNHYANESNTCHVWLLKKNYIPTYTTAKQKDITDLYGYKFKQLNNDAQYCERLVLDVGRVPSEVYEKLKEDLFDRLPPRKNTWDEYVMLLVLLPIRIFVLKGATAICWQLTDLPTREEYDDIDNDDSYQSQEEIIQRFAITPEEHNKCLR